MKKTVPFQDMPESDNLNGYPPIAKSLLPPPNKLRRSEAIKANCLNCCAGNNTSVRCCPIVDCPLWPYRFGRNPQNGYKVFLDRDFYEAHADMPQEEFNRLLLAEAHQRGKDGKS